MKLFAKWLLYFVVIRSFFIIHFGGKKSKTNARIPFLNYR